MQEVAETDVTISLHSGSKRVLRCCTAIEYNPRSCRIPVLVLSKSASIIPYLTYKALPVSNKPHNSILQCCLLCSLPLPSSKDASRTASLFLRGTLLSLQLSFARDSLNCLAIWQAYSGSQKCITEMKVCMVLS